MDNYSYGKKDMNLKKIIKWRLLNVVYHVLRHNEEMYNIIIVLWGMIEDKHGKKRFCKFWIKMKKMKTSTLNYTVEKKWPWGEKNGQVS